MILGQKDPLEEGMATHSSILAGRIPMDRGAWRATVQSTAKSRTRLKQLSPLHTRNIGWLCLAELSIFKILIHERYNSKHEV